MKTVRPVSYLLFLLALPLLADRATAQGCDLGIANIPQCYADGKVTEYGQICCSGGSCAGSGADCSYCSMGYGVCPAGQTGSLTTANWSYSEACCDDECQPPEDGCGDEDWNQALCECQEQTSPIIIDTTGAGFSLTSPENGVVFDIRGDGHPMRLAWTAPNSGNAFLALDRNDNGLIDSGKELFGNFTEQSPFPRS